MIAHANHMVRDLLGRGVVILILLIPLLLGTVTASASGALDPDAFNLNGQGLLWKIEKDGSPGPSYLLGTMHSTEDQVVAVAQAVRPLLKNVDRLLVEVEEEASRETQVLQSMVLSDGRTLQRILPPRLFDRVAMVGKHYGISPEQINGFKPWAILILISAPPSEASRRAVGRLPLDERLQLEAKIANVETGSLEKTEEQLAPLQGLGDSGAIRFIEARLRDVDTMEFAYASEVREYLKGNVAHGYKTILSDLNSVPEDVVSPYLDRLVHQRNARMAVRADGFLQNERALIAVGALHLPGETGLVEQFRALGYTVTPLQ